MGDNQTSGASFRIIVDTGDWDAAVGMNDPGQGGHPDHPHYEDLFELWARDGFHPALYSREKVESLTGERMVLDRGDDARDPCLPGACEGSRTSSAWGRCRTKAGTGRPPSTRLRPNREGP